MDAKKNLENFKKLVSEEDSSWLEKAKWRRDNREWLKPKYNLTFWQRLQLPFMYIFWLGLPEEKRKSWHRVKKGMEKHEHTFTIPESHGGYNFKRCSHEGCNLLDPVDEL